MGHNRKNANRGAAINRNANRVGELAKAVEGLEKESKATRLAIQREKERHIRHTGLILDRLERLELSTYAKARNWVKATYDRWRPAKAAPELEAAAAEELEAEPPPPELEIVEPPLVAAALGAATPIDKLAHGMAKLEQYKREHPRPVLEADGLERPPEKS